MDNSDEWPVSSMSEYAEMHEVLERWTETLNEGDKQGYNTNNIRIGLAHIKNKLHALGQTSLTIPLKRRRPWVDIGVSESTWRRDERRAKEADELYIQAESRRKLGA